MQKDALNNVHITDEQVLMTPEQLKAAFPLSLQQDAQIADARNAIADVIAVTFTAVLFAVQFHKAIKKLQHSL